MLTLFPEDRNEANNDKMWEGDNLKDSGSMTIRFQCLMMGIGQINNLNVAKSICTPHALGPNDVKEMLNSQSMGKGESPIMILKAGISTTKRN